MILSCDDYSTISIEQQSMENMRKVDQNPINDLAIKNRIQCTRILKHALSSVIAA